MFCVLIDESNDNLFITGINYDDNFFWDDLECTSFIIDINDIDMMKYIDKLWIRIMITSESFQTYEDDAPEDSIQKKQIILSEKYYLYDIKTIKKFILPINSEYIYEVSSRGLTNILDYLKQNEDLIDGDYNEILYELPGFEHNRIVILDWLKKSDISLKYGEMLPERASRFGSIDVLEWLYKNGFTFTYTSDVLDDISKVSETDNIKVLQWWFNSGLELKYTKKAFDKACKLGYTNILELWKKSGNKLKYTENILDYASGHGHVNVLEWLKNSGLELTYTSNAMDSASYECHIDVLDWWLNSGLELKYTNDAIKYMSNYKVLEWWRKSKFNCNLTL
jgi:hypothetical protein